MSNIVEVMSIIVLLYVGLIGASMYNSYVLKSNIIFVENFMMFDTKDHQFNIFLKNHTNYIVKLLIDIEGNIKPLTFLVKREDNKLHSSTFDDDDEIISFEKHLIDDKLVLYKYVDYEIIGTFELIKI